MYQNHVTVTVCILYKHRLITYYVTGISNGHVIPLVNAVKHSVSVAKGFPHGLFFAALTRIVSILFRIQVSFIATLMLFNLCCKSSLPFRVGSLHTTVAGLVFCTFDDSEHCDIFRVPSVRS